MNKKILNLVDKIAKKSEGTEAIYKVNKPRVYDNSKNICLLFHTM